MPTYDYLCKCGKEFEVFQRITAEPVAKCPSCGKKARRQISAGAGLVFKGSGFYVTDYKRNNGGCSQSESPDKSDSSDSKPEGKTADPTSQASCPKAEPCGAYSSDK